MELTNKSVKVLDKSGEDFLYLLRMFVNLSHATVKEEICIGPQIRRIMYDEDFGRKRKSTEFVTRKSVTLFFIVVVCGQNIER
jgi:hypothetical protein